MKQLILIGGILGVICGLLLFMLGVGSSNTNSVVFGMVILVVSAIGLIIRKVFDR
jgi:hypothetical protein